MILMNGMRKMSNKNIIFIIATSSPATPSILPNPPQQSSPILTATESITPASLHLLQQLQAVGIQQQILQGKNRFVYTNTFDVYAK